MFNSFPVWYNDFCATICLKCGEILYLVRQTQRVGQNRKVAEQNILGSNIVWNLKHLPFITFVKTTYLDRKNVVGLASRYEMDVQWIKSAWRRDIPHPLGCPLGPTNLLYKGYRIPFPGVKGLDVILNMDFYRGNFPIHLQLRVLSYSLSNILLSLRA